MQNLSEPPTLQNAPSNYSQASQYSTPQAAAVPSHGPTVMSNQDFLSRVEACRREIDSLSGNISQIANLHQRAISSPDSGSSAALENLVSQTQILNTRIRDQIKYLETDAARSGGAVTKDSQIRSLKNQFKTRLEQYQAEEQTYRKRYQEQIARQYRIVNPDASEDEVQEAATANWGDEGVFQTAVCLSDWAVAYASLHSDDEEAETNGDNLQLKSNRTGAATSVLGAVRARHNDIVQIEKTLTELNQLFQDLAEAVIIQEPAVQAADEQTSNVVKDTEQANVQLTKGVDHARRARKLKWWLFFIVVLIVVALALILGLYFGLPHAGAHSGS